MKFKDIQIGGHYLARFQGRIIEVVVMLQAEDPKKFVVVDYARSEILPRSYPAAALHPLKVERAKFALYTPSPDPLREALQAVCGAEPPAYVKGYDIKNLTDSQVSELQDWCSVHARPEWATGLSMLEAAEMIVAGAIENANIPGVDQG